MTNADFSQFCRLYGTTLSALLLTFGVLASAGTVNLQALRTDFLNVHNQLRAHHAAPPLKLDVGLNSYAQRVAEQNAVAKVLKHSGGTYGECLWSGPSTSTVSGQNIVQNIWYAEIVNYNWYTPGYSQNTGDFTQVVWKNSTLFGVGVATATNGAIYVAASYSPIGNVVQAGTFQKNVLPPNGVIPTTTTRQTTKKTVPTLPTTTVKTSTTTTTTTKKTVPTTTTKSTTTTRTTPTTIRTTSTTEKTVPTTHTTETTEETIPTTRTTEEQTTTDQTTPKTTRTTPRTIPTTLKTTTRSTPKTTTEIDYHTVTIPTLATTTRQSIWVDTFTQLNEDCYMQRQFDLPPPSQSHTSTLDECAKKCVKFKPCKSFTYVPLWTQPKQVNCMPKYYQCSSGELTEFSDGFMKGQAAHYVLKTATTPPVV